MAYKMQENYLNYKVLEIFYEVVPWTSVETLASSYFMRLGDFSGVREEMLSKKSRKISCIF